MPTAGMLAATAQLGISNASRLEAQLGAVAPRGGPAGAVGRVGMVFAWDVWTWVPELMFGGGAVFAGGNWQPQAVIELRARGFLSRSLSVAVSGGARVDESRVTALVGLTGWWTSGDRLF